MCTCWLILVAEALRVFSSDTTKHAYKQNPGIAGVTFSNKSSLNKLDLIRNSIFLVLINQMVASG